jgi:hypothetical protein
MPAEHFQVVGAARAEIDQPSELPGIASDAHGEVVGRNQPASAIRGALEDQEGYYLIAFQPDDETFEKAKGTPAKGAPAIFPAQADRLKITGYW